MIKKYYLYFLMTIIAFVCGWFARGYFSPVVIVETKTIEGQPKIEEKIVTKTTTQIQYVEKVVDPLTGEKEKTDVDLRINQPSVSAKVNDKQYNFSLLSGEQQKFQDGKITLEQNSGIRIDIKVPTYQQKWRVGGYGAYSNDDKWSIGIRANRQFHGWDLDATADKDKKVGVMFTKWL